MRNSPATRSRLASIATLALLTLHPATVLAHSPFPDRGYLENGLVHTLISLDQAVPLAMLGIAMAGTGTVALALAALALPVGVVLGLLFAEPLAFSAIRLLGPLLMGAGGLALLLPVAWRKVAVPVIALIGGTVLGLAIYADGPEDDGWLQFATGAACSGGWLMLMTAFLRQRISWLWLRIPERIVGSWLVAIALLLAGASLNPRLRIDVMPPSAEQASPPVGLDLSRQP